MTQVVTGCDKCPFKNWGELGGSFCNITNEEFKEYAYDDSKPVGEKCVTVTPDWCPLKKESITIEFEKK